MPKADRIALGIACACALFGLGWQAREWFGPAVVRTHEHTVAEMPVVAESLVVRYEFDSTTCMVRRK